MKSVNIIGAGISGLCAAIELARKNIASNLISSMPSERAQSVLAEGGINAVLDTMGEYDSLEEHFSDTMKGGVYLEDPVAVRDLVSSAPDIVHTLSSLGVPFHTQDGKIIQRNFGGQKKKRTAYAKSSTGKMIMTALIDQVRMYESKGLVRRYPHHVLSHLDVRNGALISVTVNDLWSSKSICFPGPCILCTGGLNGLFTPNTTGTLINTGNAAAIAFSSGVIFSNLEFIQFHPTTVEISGKRMLISEAARGEGARLFAYIDGKKFYFMEEKYPELGNLMPRDVISREMALLEREKHISKFYLDTSVIKDRVWDEKLSDMRKEIISHLNLDPAKNPIPVSPGIHYFMGGVRVDNDHETNIKGLFAAGEAACKYHGANRLGGNSMLGAFYGGMVAGRNAAKQASNVKIKEGTYEDECLENSQEADELSKILFSGLKIIRDEETMLKCLSKIDDLIARYSPDSIDRKRALLGYAFLESALSRKESRGSHYRLDYPHPHDDFRKRSCAFIEKGKVKITFEDLEVHT